MKHLLFTMVALLVFSLLVGCGSLRGERIPINRDLTADELTNFENLADDYFILPVPGIYWRQKMLVEEDPGFRVAKVTSFLNPIPFIGPGVIFGGMTNFNDDGTRDKTARSFGLKPFFSHIKVREYYGDGEAETVLSMTRVFSIFGGGKLENKRFGWLFVPIGTKRADIKKVLPKRIRIMKSYSR